jgi:hypothetical protein
MNQIWNIFRKDLHHHWPEIAASLALLVAFAWLDIRSWSQPAGAKVTGTLAVFLSAEMLPSLVDVLLPLSWILLIVRVVQGESLVGDRQFWVTRPYDWKQLVAAKALFVLAFIDLPLLLAGAFLLAHAGLHPTHFIVGLLWIQLFWILVLFLWMAALATVTNNIAQMLLAVLFIVLDVIGTSALSSIIRKSNSSGDVDLWWGLLVIGVAVAIIFLQYSRRKTALSRWMVVGICALLTLISVASSRATPPDRTSILREYPISSGNPPTELGLIRTDTHGGAFAPIYDEEVSIQLPLSVSGIPNESFLRLDGMIVTITNAKGFHWDSGWKTDSQWLFPEQQTANLFFQIKQDIFNQLNSEPVTAHLLLAFTLYRDRNRQRFVVPSGKFSLPEVGICTTELQYSRGIRCLAPLRRPAFLLVTSQSTASTCPLDGAETSGSDGVFLHAFVQGSPEPAEMGISPVVQFDINLSDWDSFAVRAVSPGVCPGTPLTLSNPEQTGRRSIELQIDNLSLGNFRQRLPTGR